MTDINKEGKYSLYKHFTIYKMLLILITNQTTRFRLLNANITGPKVLQTMSAWPSTF